MVFLLEKVKDILFHVGSAVVRMEMGTFLRMYFSASGWDP